MGLNKTLYFGITKLDEKGDNDVVMEKHKSYIIKIVATDNATNTATQEDVDLV